MTIIKNNGFIFREIIKKDNDEDELGKIHHIPLIDFIYGYEDRDSQRIPICTACIVPYTKEEKLYFGIGLAECSDDDFPIKAKGRRLSEARARGAINAGRNLNFKAHWTDVEEGAARLCAIFAIEQHAFVAVGDMEFIVAGMTKRIQKSIDYLCLKINPESLI